MTFLELYGAKLDRELGSADTTLLFTTARRKAAINDAQQEWVRLTESFTREASVALVDGTAEYDLEAVVTAADYQWLCEQGLEVNIVDASGNTRTLAGDELPRRTIAWLNRYDPSWRSAAAATPLAHYIREDGGTVTVGLYPAPSIGAGATWTLRVPYVARPADLTLDADVPFSVAGNAKAALYAWHQALVHYAAGLLERLRKDRVASDAQMQLFGAFVTDYLQRHRARAPQHITFQRSYREKGSSVYGGILYTNPRV
jgi:hypothetical protein